ncbi:MAG: S41 family peptidase [Planctomycetota bacterium]|jgi:C-terminal processing protease CtpA/Prc
MRKLLAGWALLLLSVSAPVEAADRTYEKDAVFALDTLEKECRTVLKARGVNWKTVRKDILSRVRKVRTDQDHYDLMLRLVAHLRDGHAYVVVPKGTDGLKWPGLELKRGPGMFLVESGKRVLVRASFKDARRTGIEPGMEVLKLDGMPAQKWLDERVAALREHRSFSTEQQARFCAWHWGLGGEDGSRLKVQLRSVKGKSKKATLMRNSKSMAPWGPAFAPEGLETIGRQSYGKTGSGFGYIHLRKIPGDLPAQLDTMLAKLGDCPGIILDFRGNGGGAVDHDAVLGRFVPEGKSISFGRTFKSAGEKPYGGNVVAIVDAGVRSAGETISGYFLQYGRAYGIGDTRTAGMSGRKKTIELPSKKFSLYVVTRSHGRELNKGEGIEGIGIPPHEIVDYDRSDLAAGVDTLIRRAEELLAEFPSKRVPYKPERFGWKR